MSVDVPQGVKQKQAASAAPSFPLGEAPQALEPEQSSVHSIAAKFKVAHHQKVRIKILREKCGNNLGAKKNG